jgi:hypothetical protein
MAAENYTIPIAGNWTLEDLYVFPRTYEQVYFLVYSLAPDHSDREAERIARAYESLPWQGGYSAVSFYNQLKYITPKRERPAVVSIEYSSPGWIELALILSAALNVQQIVKSIAKSLGYANNVYNDIIKGMQQRKILRLEVREKELELKQRELQFIDGALKKCRSFLEFQVQPL